MKKLIRLITILLVVFFVNACHPAKYYLEDVLGGEYELYHMKKWRGINGKIEGCFFLGIGGIEGKISTSSSFQFQWSPKPNEKLISELPFSKLKFLIDNNKKIPTVEFRFSDYWWNHSDYSNSPQTENLNNYIQDEYRLVIAIVRISKEQYDKEFTLD